MDLNQLMKSAITQKVRFIPKVVVYRTRYSLSEVVRIKEQRMIGPLPEYDLICELQIGDQILAKGEIVTTVQIETSE